VQRGETKEAGLQILMVIIQIMTGMAHRAPLLPVDSLIPKYSGTSNFPNLMEMLGIGKLRIRLLSVIYPFITWISFLRSPF
jgi:hypothetical protein